MRVIDGGGHILDAKYFVEPQGGQLALILESRTGKPPRNADYKPALNILLTRLGALGAVMWDAVVDSKNMKAQGVSDSDRRL